MVSRLHATIEGRDGRFVLTDRSTNGTYLAASPTGRFRRVHLDDTKLATRGCIGLGQRPRAGTSHTLYFRIIKEQ